jgi:hypothetical protein
MAKVCTSLRKNRHQQTKLGDNQRLITHVCRPKKLGLQMLGDFKDFVLQYHVCKCFLLWH